ncbi:hypothetical protein [Desertivirga arenae]|uniref:hypothetical protein n=1 Tax=Desertivirga arenae TaxID=2810309 RepID=UPI001A97CC60|nr:hypothetical protein [Pedobacter sp. SYSU D00823]
MKYFTFSITVLVLAFSSCTSKFYTPALINSNVSYQPKPLSSDSVKAANYLSGSINNALGEMMADEIIFGQLNYNRAHVYNNVNIVYGAYGFLGTYKNGALDVGEPYYFEKKSFSGGGGRLSANYFLRMGRADFRIIGFELGVSREFGEYSRFRDEVRSAKDFYSDAGNVVTTAGLTTEIAWHTKRSLMNQHAFRLYVGPAFRQNKMENKFNNVTTYETSTTRSSVFLSYFLQVQRFNFSFDASIFSSRFGLGYRF